MRIIIIFFLLCSVCYAKNIEVDGIVYNANEKYSWKDYTGKSLQDATDLEGITIFGSCFSQELPATEMKGNVKVFPEILKKITFINCNLDNVKINKPTWVTMGCSERNFKVKKDINGKDLGDWLIDENGIRIKEVSE